MRLFLLRITLPSGPAPAIRRSNAWCAICRRDRSPGNARRPPHEEGTRSFRGASSPRQRRCSSISAGLSSRLAHSRMGNAARRARACASRAVSAGSDRVSPGQIVRDIRAGCARGLAVEGRHVAPLCAARADATTSSGAISSQPTGRSCARQPLLRKLRSCAASWATCGVTANSATACSTCSMCADAARVPVGIVSNALSGQVHLDFLEEHGLIARFAVEIHSDAARVRKPNPEMILLATRELGIDAGRRMVCRRQFRPRRAVRPPRRDRRQHPDGGFRHLRYAL